MVRDLSRRWTRVTRMLAALVATAVVTGCGVPIPPEVPDTTTRGGTTTGPDVDRLVPIDVRTEELVEALVLLGERIAEARDLMRAAADDPADADARAGIVGVLLGAPGGGEPPGVLPAVEPDRGGTASDDLLTALITLAGDVGGERGRLVLELVRDPMLGDLGAWQRDPVGVIAVLRAIAEEERRAGGGAPGDTRALDAEMLEIPGELTRALGYAFVVASSTDEALVAHAAEQGAGRLGVVLIALEIAIERLGGPA
jgi:hypothetical protein